MAEEKSELEKLAGLTKEEFGYLVIQMQLDEHAGRLRELETAVFPVRK